MDHFILGGGTDSLLFFIAILDQVFFFFFLYSGDKLFIRYVLSKYFLSVGSLSFAFLRGVFQRKDLTLMSV